MHRATCYFDICLNQPYRHRPTQSVPSENGTAKVVHMDVLELRQVMIIHTKPLIAHLDCSNSLDPNGIHIHMNGMISHSSTRYV